MTYKLWFADKLECLTATERQEAACEAQRRCAELGKSGDMMDEQGRIVASISPASIQFMAWAN